MDLSSIEDFIRQQRESLEHEKRQYQQSYRHVSESPQRVPNLEKLPPPPPNNNNESPSNSINQNSLGDASQDSPEMNPHHRLFLLERRAATAGEKPPPSTVSESFYKFFPSFNSKEQQKLEDQRKDYYKYLKMMKTSNSVNVTPRGDLSLPTLACQGDLDERRRLEKDRLAAQFQTSKQKSILNYQIVEARNKRAEEEAQRKKQEYHDELKKQIDERKRQLEARKTLDKMEDDILNRKIELDELKAYEEWSPQPPVQREQFRRQEATPRKAQSVIDNEEMMKKQNSYDCFAQHSAREPTTICEAPTRDLQRTTDHKPCCENYKLILEKLETLCRWRDDFVAKNKKVGGGGGCLLCDSGSLKNCNFCDYHDRIVKKKPQFEDSSFTDSSDKEQQKIRKRKQRESLKAIQDTPKVIYRRSLNDDRGEEKENSREDKRNSFINFDDIPLPAHRKQPPIVERRTKPKATEKEPIMSDSRLRLNEMKKVEWKWDIPAVQTNTIDKRRPEKVLTQLGAIRKQLQMEQLKIE